MKRDVITETVSMTATETTAATIEMTATMTAVIAVTGPETATLGGVQNPEIVQRIGQDEMIGTGEGTIAAEM